MKNFLEIEDKILSVLETLKWNWKIFNDIYNYYTLESNSFPYVWFELSNEIYTQINSIEDLWEWTYTIYIFQEINKDEWIDRLWAKKIVQNWVKKISDLLRNNYTLDWDCFNSKIENIEYMTQVDEKWIVYFWKIDYKVSIYRDINNI